MDNQNNPEQKEQCHRNYHPRSQHILESHNNKKQYDPGTKKQTCRPTEQNQRPKHECMLLQSFRIHKDAKKHMLDRRKYF